MTALYQTRAQANGGRNGSAATDDGLLQVQLAYPRELGGSGDKTNPEQLFAAGYAACFSNAVLHVAKQSGVAIKDAPTMATVGLNTRAEGGFALSVALAVELTGVSQAQAEELVHAAHQVCPYSNAVRGNVEVQLTVTAVAG